MRNVGIWFFLSCKRYLHRVSFLLILLVLPVITVFVRGLEQKEGTEIRIAVCVEGGAGADEGETAPERFGSGVEGPAVETFRSRYAEGPAVETFRSRYAESSAAEPSGSTYTVGSTAEAILAVSDGKSGRDLTAPLEWILARDLINRSPEAGMFRFYLCDHEEELRDQVASRQAECGYVLSANLREKLDAKDYKRCIRVYTAPSTVAAKLSSEVVFSALMARYDRELFQDYVENGEAFLPLADRKEPEELGEESGALYDAWMENGGTFRFVYETMPEATEGTGHEPVSGMAEETGHEPVSGMAEGTGHEPVSGMAEGAGHEPVSGMAEGTGHEPVSGMAEGTADGPIPGTAGAKAENEAAGETGYEAAEGKAAGTAENGSRQQPLFPVRGIVAVYVFVAGLYSGAVSLADQRKGLFLALPAASRNPCRLAAMAGPVVLAAVSGLLALASGGSLGMGHLLGETGAMAAYAAGVTVFSWILGMVCRREEVVCCLIPFFLTGSLLFCPVIVDVGRYVPALARVGKLFLPWYYLSVFPI